MVPGAGLEPARITPTDFKSVAFANFAIRAHGAATLKQRLIIIH